MNSLSLELIYSYKTNINLQIKYTQNTISSLQQ